ncbi:MAG: hypothetical protein CSB46_07345 [Micrococcales bacterium]|nr:MAG: hypothetical protein CSB46_07345 [Micrococcales bacterium]
MSVVAADHDTLATVGAGARAAGSSVEEVALGDSAGAAPDEQATLDQQARPGDDFDDLIDAAPDIGPVDFRRREDRRLDREEGRGRLRRTPHER